MFNFCTLFDSSFLTRGLAMYESLYKNCEEFHLYIFAFDEVTFHLLTKMDLPEVTVVSLSDFEDEKLLQVKPLRSKGEYCWTCTPSIIKYAIEKFQLSMCTYLDADLYFFNDPKVLLNELGEKSILITEHRYTPKYDQSLNCGIYCVQFMTFRNDDFGMSALSWWREACINWCYAYFEDGKFGDQKYLDDWPARFEGVHVLQHFGGGVAPWNIQQYNLIDNDFDLVFYHFHGFKFLKNKRVDLGPYRLKKSDVEMIYTPYILHLESIFKRLTLFGGGDYNGTTSIDMNWKYPIKLLKSFFRGEYNIVKKEKFLGY